MTMTMTLQPEYLIWRMNEAKAKVSGYLRRAYMQHGIEDFKEALEEKPKGNLFVFYQFDMIFAKLSARNAQTSSLNADLSKISKVWELCKDGLRLRALVTIDEGDFNLIERWRSKPWVDP